MLPKKWLERMTQEELYAAFLQISEKIDNDALAEMSADHAAVVPFSDFMEGAMELLKDPEKIHGIPCGYDEIDQLTRGFEPGELIVVGAETGVGKSMLVQNMFHNIGMRGIPNLFISLEMPNTEAQKRYIEMQMGWDKTKDRDASAAKIEKMPLFAYTSDNMNMEELDTKIGEAIERDGIRIIGVDHLHYFTRSTENASGEIGYLVRRFKNLANKHKVPILLISHLTKLKKKGMPDKSSLRDSSFIAQDADAVIMLARDYQSEDPVTRNILKWEVQKNRTRGFLGGGELYIHSYHKVKENQ